MVSRPRRREGSSSTTGSSSSGSCTTMTDQQQPSRKAKSSLLLRKRLRFPFFRIGGGGADSITAADGADGGAGAIGTIEEEREGALTSSSSEDTFNASLHHTRIVATAETTPQGVHDTTLSRQEGEAHEDAFYSEPYGPFCASAALLQHSYLERMCGVDTRLIQGEDVVNRLNKLPDDPSVQESIECVFAAQQELLLEEDCTLKDLQTPSSLQQCLLKNRSISHLPPLFQHETRARSPRKALEPPPIVVASSSSSSPLPATTITVEIPVSLPKNQQQQPSVSLADDEQRPPCICCSNRNKRPILEPDQWPQRPLLMRPTPHGGTVVTGIRFAGSTEYLWKARRSALTWPQALHQHWKKKDEPLACTSPSAKTTTVAEEDNSMCPHCMILPINNGKELPGESLVTDFESEAFSGSILVRLKDCKGTTCDGHEQPKGYFDGVHRRYQVVVRGQFKREIPWTECFAGFQLERPAGKLPPKWIVNGALNVVRFFAPQLQTRIHGARPYSLTPLGSTPQSLIVKDDSCKRDVSMEIAQEEPRDDAFTLIGHASTAASSMQRARYRKKHFDKLYSESSQSLMTDPNKVYTFEFLQHLLSFDDFSIELGSMVGSVPLRNILNGQPLQIMASHRHPVPNEPNAIQNRFWCFDIWHEMLIPDAKESERLEGEEEEAPP